VLLGMINLSFVVGHFLCFGIGDSLAWIFVDELVGELDLSPNFAGVLVHIMSEGRATCALNFMTE
jgi:hypothetical protein